MVGFSLRGRLVQAAAGTLLAGFAGLPAPARAAEPETHPVLRIERWIEGGARVAWSRQGEWLAYDKVGTDGRYDVYLTSTDRLAERCLTCEMYEFRKDNVLNPVWHPSGERLIVQVQSHPKRLKFVADPLQLLTPDRALHSELYDIDRKGKHFTLLTRFGDSGTAVLDPHFSFDGERLLWSERIKARKGRYGAWQLRSGRFRVNRVGIAKLKKIRSHPAPADALIVPQGYTPNDRGALVAANLEPGQSPDTLDLYRLSLDGGEPERLTHSRGGVEEYARLSPTGRHLAFTSNAEIQRHRARPVVTADGPPRTVADGCGRLEQAPADVLQRPELRPQPGAHLRRRPDLAPARRPDRRARAVGQPGRRPPARGAVPYRSRPVVQALGPPLFRGILHE